ncbi:unnamed protein product [Clonostachys rosea f. rosea IK726]|uniref:Uncharacterized protein n=1 Tax=Clonostachys rosea f. rosea IK726 TaxID=1349383 RepID=A0ACA9UPD0_BIOOC|nr:unnamed protein product [Clonostachys rosea f. rosea IK726]
MPQTLDLGIALDGGRIAFRPGEVVVGRVYRSTPLLSPAATLTISLHGRAKAKAVEKKGKRIEYRSRVDLISSEKSLQTLFSGPLHIAVGEAGDAKQWSFEMRIPAHVDPDAVKSEALKQGLYSPTGDESISQHALPASFHVQSLRNEAFVEYYLEANLEAQRQESSLSWTARIPIQVHEFRPGPPLTDNQLTIKAIPFSIRSQRLLPNMEDCQLTASQKFKKLINASSIPALCFELEVTLPTILQIGTKPIPFQLRVVPDMEKSSEVLRGVPQTITLASMKLELENLYQVQCRGMFSNIAAAWTTDTDLMCGRYLFHRSDTYEIPYSEELPIDLGEKVRLQVLNERGPSTEENYITPDIEAPNMRLTHRLKWEIKFEIARETMRASGSKVVRLLPPIEEGGEEYAKPPPETDQQDEWIKPPHESDLDDFLLLT